jgi:hypothetical protein
MGFVALTLTMLPAHRTVSRLYSRVSHPIREPLQFIVIAVMSVMSGTFPDTYRVFYLTVNRWHIQGPSRHRHRYRHRENGLGKRFSRYRDGHDAHDGHLRAYSRQEVHLYFVGPYPFNLTRRTRRWEQKTLFLRCSRSCNLCQVFPDLLITRRRYPTRGMGPRRVYREHRRVLDT